MLHSNLFRRNRWRWIWHNSVPCAKFTAILVLASPHPALQAQPKIVAPFKKAQSGADKLAARRLAKAKAIRVQWRSWARKNAAALRAMLDSKGEDFSTLEAIYRLSPPLTSTSWRPDLKSGPIQFALYVNPAKFAANGEKFSAKSRALLETIQADTIESLKKDFAAKSDFVIAFSENGGPVETQIWASGRITERGWQQKINLRTRQTTISEAPYKELVPPYDFLTAAKK